MSALILTVALLGQTPQEQDLLDWVNFRREQSNAFELAQYGSIQAFRAPVQWDGSLAAAADAYAASFTGTNPYGPPPEGLADFGIGQLFWKGHGPEYITEVWGYRPYDDQRDLDYRASILLDPRWTRAGLGRAHWAYDVDTVVVWFGEGAVVLPAKTKGKKR